VCLQNASAFLYSAGSGNPANMGESGSMPAKSYALPTASFSSDALFVFTIPTFWPRATRTVKSVSESTLFWCISLLEKRASLISVSTATMSASAPLTVARALASAFSILSLSTICRHLPSHS